MISRFSVILLLIGNRETFKYRPIKNNVVYFETIYHDLKNCFCDDLRFFKVHFVWLRIFVFVRISFHFFCVRQCLWSVNREVSILNQFFFFFTLSISEMEKLYGFENEWWAGLLHFYLPFLFFSFHFNVYT